MANHPIPGCLITFAVPCYNSEAYLDRCIESIVTPVVGTQHERSIEVLVIDDGSTDATLKIARAWEERLLGMVRVIHQENRGHGGAINHAVDLARGVYIKPVDSDDHLASDALIAMLDELAHRHAAGNDVDLFFTNYVYEHLHDKTERVVEYREQFPQGIVFDWDDVRPFPKWKFLMIHSLTCLTFMLRERGILFPEHMSYDDEVFVWRVLPVARRLAYLDINLYRYVTDRPGQSVAEDTFARRASDQVRVCTLRIDGLRIPQELPSKVLESYLVQDLGFSMVFASLACTIAGDKVHIDEKDALWEHLHEADPSLWRRVRYGFFGFWCFLPGRLGRRAFIDGCHLASYAFKLN